MPRQVGSPNATRRSDHVQGLVCHGKIIHVQNNMVATTIASVARYRNKANSSRMITRRSTKRAHLGADKNRCQFVFLSELRRLRAAIERVSESVVAIADPSVAIKMCLYIEASSAMVLEAYNGLYLNLLAPILPRIVALARRVMSQSRVTSGA